MKNHIFRIALLTLPIVAFNVLFFIIGGTDHPGSVWMAYTAIHLAWRPGHHLRTSSSRIPP